MRAQHVSGIILSILQALPHLIPYPPWEGLAPRWQWWSQHLLENLSTESKILTSALCYHLLELLVPVDFGMMPSLALRDTLRSGPKQLIDEFTLRIVLMMLIIISCGVFSVRMNFFLWPQHLKKLLFLDNWSVFILGTPDSFSWICFPLYTGC